MENHTHETTATVVRPFRVDMPEEAIAELRRHIAATRWPSRELVTDRSQGVQLATLQALVRYWATDHDWREKVILPSRGLFPLPHNADLQQLSMLSINPPTAALLLGEYVELKPGDWVIQDAGNSGVGRSVIAFAKDRGLRSVSLARRPELIDELVAAGGDLVLVNGAEISTRVAQPPATRR